MSTKAYALIACGLLVAVTLAPTALAASPKLKFGFSTRGYDAMTNAGAKPEWTQVWVTENIVSSGWTAIEDKLRFTRDRGATAVVEWYYWGSDISPNCVSYGCDGKSRAEWYSMTESLARRIRDLGVDAIVVVETEFNHNGIDSSTYAPKFDGYLAIVEDKIHDIAPGTEVAVGFGNWGTDRWSRFPQAIAEADYIGFQAMGGSTRQTKDSYLNTDNKIESTARFVKEKFGKPSIVHDVSMSSYPHPDWMYVQESFVKQLSARYATLAALGVEGVVYREYKDSGMNYEYYGPAEGYMGLFKRDGAAKPAWNDWVGGVKAHRAGTTSTTSPEPTTSTTFDAKFSSISGNEWWVQTKATGNEPIVGVDARINGGTWVALTKQSWGAWAKSFKAPDGTLELRARSSDGSTDTDSFAWNP